MPGNPIHALLVSASLGALIGLVRQWDYEHTHPGESAPAGLRTFTAWGILGCAAGLLQQAGADWAFGAALVSFTLVLGAIHIAGRKQHALGLTTFSIGLVTFAAGGLASYAEYLPATVVGAGAMLIIGSKQWTHAWTKKLSETDLRCILQFAAITGVILPLVPDKDIGPYGSFNPYKIWLMVVLVASLGFLGYVAIRWLGARAGIIMTGIAGGLASSTATTLAMSRQSRVTPQFENSLALSVVLACTMMLGRVAIVLVFVNPDVAAHILNPFILMAVPGILWALWQLRGRKLPAAAKVDTPDLINPLSLSLAIKFGLLYAMVRFLVKVTVINLPAAWIYLVSFVSGLTDMDAIAISSAQAVSSQPTGQSLTVDIAARCVVLGALSNTLVKAGLAAYFGTPGFRRAIIVALGAVFVAGCIGLLFI